MATTAIVGTQSTKVDAAACNQVYFGVVYNDPTFFSGLCPDAARPFPNTGLPFVGNAFNPMNGNYDSVGYVIPRTSKDITAGSEALAGVSNKANFIARLQWQYYTRTDARPANTTWAKNGVAFVVLSLIGKQQSNRNLTAADWTELSNRLNDPNVTMTLDNNYPLSPNSAAVYDKNGNLDFTHFSDSEGLTGPSFVFKVNGNIIGSIERKCANLMGQFALPKSNPWTTSGVSRVGVDFTPPNVVTWPAVPPNGGAPARPGSILTWRHTISAAGGTTPALGFAIGKSGFSGANVWGDGSAANHNKPVGTTPAIGPGSSYSVGWGVNRPEYATYRVVASDGGRTLCQSISWGPTAANNGAWSASPISCVTVPYNYNLQPSVVGPSGVGEVGSPIPTVNARVNNLLLAPNANKTTDSPVVQWESWRIEVPPTIPDPNAIPLTLQQNATAPCAHYNNGGANRCVTRRSGSTSFPGGVTTTATSWTGETIDPNTPVGTRICYTLSVKPYSTGAPATNWRHSAPACIRVSKQPKLQAWGNDVRTRGDIETATSIINVAGTNKLFGSWVEYGGFSVGANSGFASGSGLNNGNANTTTDSVWNKLTFANVDNSSPAQSRFGMYTLPATIPNLTAQFIGAPSGGPINSNLGTLGSGTYVTNAPNFQINKSVVGQAANKGKSIIIVSTGTVTIAEDITYEGPGGSDTFTSLDQIPQVVIIARNINIRNAATRVDAWLLTTAQGGGINTCSDRAVNAPLNSTVCEKPLTVNGPVATQHLYLRRTAGADSVAAAGTPAEVFNLRPDAYMWAYARASQAGKAQTVYSVELPPRF
jgi:hypothetical protein